MLAKRCLLFPLLTLAGLAAADTVVIDIYENDPICFNDSYCYGSKAELATKRAVAPDLNACLSLADQIDRLPNTTFGIDHIRTIFNATDGQECRVALLSPEVEHQVEIEKGGLVRFIKESSNNCFGAGRDYTYVSCATNQNKTDILGDPVLVAVGTLSMFLKHDN